MALTNEKAKQDVKAYEVIFQMAKLMKNLTDDPKALEKSIKDAYSLTEAEQKKAQEAMSTLAENRTLVEEQKKLQQKIAADTALNDEKSKQLSEEWKRLSKEASELKQWEKDVKKQFEELTQAKAVLAQREQAVKVTESKVAEEKSATEAAKKEAEKIVSELKLRASKVRDIAEGL